MALIINDPFDTFDSGFWNRSDFAIAASFNQTAWDADHVEIGPGALTLRLNGDDKDGKPFTGAEIQSEEHYGYGSYEMRMQASGESGVVSAFFLFTGEFFGAARQNEIDFEFLGNDTTKVNLNYYYGSQKLADFGEVVIDLGFDAAEGLHDYRIDWMPDAIRWIVDGQLIHEVLAETAPLPIPDEDMLVYGDIWTGDTQLEAWHGPVDPNVNTTAIYDAFSYVEAEIDLPVDATGAVTFAGTSDALVIDMSAGAYTRAAKVLAIGDSLTEGWIDVNDPGEVPEERDGYRLDLFEGIVASGGWFDYVGFKQTGPDDMMDRDHSAVGGVPLRNIVASNGTAGDADLSDNLDAFAPDIVLLMAGTNDFNGDESQFFSNRFGAIMSNMNAAIDQFLAMDGSAAAYLVISTLAPKTRANVPAEFADYLNEGYSTVAGQPVAGDAGNGTWVPGLRALVEGRAAANPNILLFENPVGVDDLTSDQVHFSDAAYARYAADLAALLESEIGLQGGTPGGDPEFMQVTGRVVGSDAGDRIFGTDGADTIDGGGGADYIDGGAGGDTIVFGPDTLTGTRDVVAGFSVAEGDTIDLTRIATAYGWTAAQVLANLSLEDTATGVQLTLTIGGDQVTFAEILGNTAAGIAAALGIDDDPIPSADDDGNLALSAPDLDIDADEVGAVAFAVTGIDADATATITVSDGSASVTSGAIAADGTVTLDLSGLADGTLATSVTATDAGGNTASVAGPGLTLDTETPPDPPAPGLQVTGTAGDDQLRGIDGENTTILGLGGRDTLMGRSGDDTVIGGADADVLRGGDGADLFVFEAADLASPGDDLKDFDLAEGDRLEFRDMLTGFDGDDISGHIRLVRQGTIGRIEVDADGGGDAFTTFAYIRNGRNLDLEQMWADGDLLITTSGPPPASADDDGNLTLSAPDLDIDADEVGAVDVTLTGLDADATATITISDGSASVTSGTIAADGTVTLDLSGLADGTLTSSVTATDAGGATATVAGPDLTLATQPDMSADADGNLALSAPDLDIDAEEVGAVAFAVTGIDADATATITVSDGSASVTSGAIAADGTVTLDLSGLADGALATSVTATDTGGNTASVAGPGLTLDTETPPDPPAPGVQVTGTAGDDQLRGIDGENTTILGLGGRDTLMGRSGDDTVIGGADADVLRGGDGADLFVFEAADLASPGDDLKDFDLAEGDRLEFRDMLAGFDGDDISGHIRLVRQGTIGRIEVDADGGGDAFTTFAYIRNGRNLDLEQMWADGDLLITG